MKKVCSKISILILGILMTMSVTNVHVSANLTNHARAAAAMSLNDGKFIYQKNAHKRYAIASTTKLMTLYLALNKIKHMHNGWHQRITISNNLSKMSKSPDLGNYRLTAGHRYKISTLYKASLVASSNASAITLGKWVGGSNAHFIKMMNQQAQQWQIGRQAHFVSASGLENNDLYRYGIRYGNYHDYNRVSADAITIIAQHLLKLYPKILNDAKHRIEYLGHQSLKNENELLKGGYNYHSDLKVDGLKTGYTPLAGYCLVSTSQLPHHNHLILTTLNDPKSSSDQSKMIKQLKINLQKEY